MNADAVYAAMPEAPAGLGAPDGASRRKLTVRDVWRMIDAEVLAEDDRVELWGGELIEMSAKQVRHEWIKNALAEYLIVHLYKRFQVAVESTIYLSRTVFVEPDLSIWKRGLFSTDVRGPDLLLAIEVADTSYGTDMTTKPTLYAAHDAPLLWIVDAREGRTPEIIARTEPTDVGYANERRFGLEDTVTLPFAPDLSFTLRDVLYADEDSIEP